MSVTSVGQIGLDLVVNQNQFHKQMTGVQSLARKTGKVLAAAFGLKQLVNFSKQCIELSSDLQEVQNVVDVTFPNMTSKVDKFAKSAASSFGLSETMAKKFTGTYGAMAKAFGFTESAAYEMGSTLTGLAGDIASFYNITQDEAYTKLKSVFTGETETLKDLGIVMTQSALDAYALSNGYNKTTKSMSEAEKVALRYAFVQEQLSAATGDFSRTADSWANQTRLLKLNLEQLGATIGGSLVNAFKPLLSTLNVVIGKFTEFAKVVSDSLGKIFGWKYEDSGGGISSDLETGAGSANDIASGIGSAADSAKKLKQQLRGIDELNVKTSNSNSGSSGGTGSSSSGSASSSSSGQWVKTDSIFKDYESELDSFYKLGEHIGEIIAKSLNDIKWEEVYESARDFGTGFASFLNGLISPETFGAVGKTIAGALNTAVEAALAIGQEFDFYDFGVSLGTGVNEFFNNFDFEDLAETLNTWVDGIEDAIAGFLDTVTWDDILAKAGDFLGTLELDTVTGIIKLFTISKILKFTLGGGLAKTIATMVAAKIAAQFGTAPIVSIITAGLQALFGSSAAQSALVFMFPKTAAVVSAVSGWVTGTLIPALSSVGSTIATAISGPWGFAIAGAFAGILLIVTNWDSVVEAAQTAWNFVTQVFEKAGEWFSTNVVTPVSDFFKKLWENVSGFFSGLWEDISSLWGTVSQWFSENVIEPVVSFFQGLFKRVGQIFEGLWLIVQAVWIVVSDWFDEYVITPIVGFFKGLWEKVSGFFSQLWENIKGVWNIVSSWFNEKVITPVTGFFKGVWTNVKTYFSGLWTDVKEIWGVVTTWFNNKIITPVKTAFKTACDAIGGFFSSLWNGIKKGVVGAMNAVISGIEKGINFLITGINKVIKGFNKVAGWAAKVVGSNWGGVDLVPKVSLSRIQGFETGGFPSRASLFWAGERGIPELVGSVGGQPAVAGGAEITGIREAIYSTAMQELEILREQNSLLKAILEKEFGITDDAVGKSARRYAQDYFNRTGKEAYTF